MKIKAITLLLGLFMLATLFAGCHEPAPASEPLVAPGELNYEELNTKERFRKYNSIGIRAFSTEDVMMINVDPDERSKMDTFKKVAFDYFQKNFFDQMKGNYYKKYGLVENDADAKNFDLVIDARFVEIDRGSRAARYWGTGGWTSVKVKGTMTETATGKVVVKFQDSKVGKGGSFGGDSDDLLRNNCEELGGNLSDFLRDVY